MALLLATSLLSRIALAGTRGAWIPWKSLFGPAVDGTWSALSVDGRPVPSRDYSISITGGQVSSGYDGCNGWGVSDHPDLIVVELEECPPNPTRDAYWAAVRGRGSSIELRDDDRLVTGNGRHVAVFSRRR